MFDYNLTAGMVRDGRTKEFGKHFNAFHPFHLRQTLNELG